ncbi:hypothetical protein OPV22_027026 [Ensete ventricosum]|uniref:Uncharacterized protein n=1 Tax=Ensete ventricosum TaxID=4639 RepID=A0AAV8PYY3_ENSVE|nr:hypothetical protein OPV22_027026 [Ensete ventricosum]
MRRHSAADFHTGRHYVDTAQPKWTPLVVPLSRSGWSHHGLYNSAASSSHTRKHLRPVERRASEDEFEFVGLSCCPSSRILILFHVFARFRYKLTSFWG